MGEGGAHTGLEEAPLIWGRPSPPSQAVSYLGSILSSCSLSTPTLRVPVGPEQLPAPGVLLSSIPVSCHLVVRSRQLFLPVRVCGSSGVHSGLPACGLRLAGQHLDRSVRTRVGSALPPGLGALRAELSVWKRQTQADVSAPGFTGRKGTVPAGSGEAPARPSLQSGGAPVASF